MEESDAIAAVWDFLYRAGHSMCGSWFMDLDGVITCACSAVFEPFAEAALTVSPWRPGEVS
jgi:succinate dehydrogenase/fumarate reductase-like Fe-S protein